MIRKMLVRDLTRTDPVTVPADASLRDVVGRMLAGGEGCVIVVDADGNPAGVITDTDVLQTVYQVDRPLAEIDAVAVAGAPEFTLEPSVTAGKASRMMVRQGETEVLVMDGLDLLGTVSLSRIVSHPSVSVGEATDDERRTEWTGTGTK